MLGLKQKQHYKFGFIISFQLKYYSNSINDKVELRYSKLTLVVKWELRSQWDLREALNMKCDMLSDTILTVNGISKLKLHIFCHIETSKKKFFLKGCMEEMKTHLNLLEIS